MISEQFLKILRDHVGDGGKLSHENGLVLLAEVELARKALNTPIVEPFAEAAASEAKHQVYRWGDEQDATKTAWDWFWTLGYLGGKAAQAALSRDWTKAKHHTVTAAALLANWHRHIVDAERADGN
jgi:hypothetical protein